MTCEEIKRQLSEDIERAHAADVQDHIGRCERCERVYRELLSVAELSHHLRDAVEAPEDFGTRVRAELTRRSAGRSYWRPAFALCATLVVSGVLWFAALPDIPEAGMAVMPLETPESLESAQNVPTLEAERVDPYVDLVLEEPSERERVLRVPRRIKVRRTNLHDDFYLQNVSH